MADIQKKVDVNSKTVDSYASKVKQPTKNGAKKIIKKTIKRIEPSEKRQPIEKKTEGPMDTTTTASKKRKAEEMEIDTNEDASAPPIFPADKVQKTNHLEERSINIPRHRLNPLKENWLKISAPIVEYLKLNIRFNIKTKQVQIKTCADTEDASTIQKAADFVQAFVYGFEIEDALALIRLYDLYLETFDIKDVKFALKGDHVGRAIGRLAGKNGKTRFVLENATKTRIIIADSRIHILGAFQNIAACRRAVSNLILGSPPSKVFGNLSAYVSHIGDR